MIGLRDVLEKRSHRHAGPLVLALAATIFGACSLVDSVTNSGPLSVQKFAVSPREIPAGSTAILSWDVEGAESIEIDNGVGTVGPRDSREIRPARTTTYTLRAASKGSEATSTIQVVVEGTTSVSSASSSSAPLPTPDPTPESCGAPATAAGSCAVSVTRLASLAAGECLEVTRVESSLACPVALAVARSLRIEVEAQTSGSPLTWRRAAGSSDVLLPDSGSVARQGTTSLLLSDIVLDSSLTIEIVRDGSPIYSVRVGSY